MDTREILTTLSTTRNNIVDHISSLNEQLNTKLEAVGRGITASRTQLSSARWSILERLREKIPDQIDRSVNKMGFILTGTIFGGFMGANRSYDPGNSQPLSTGDAYRIMFGLWMGVSVSWTLVRLYSGCTSGTMQQQAEDENDPHAVVANRV